MSNQQFEQLRKENQQLRFELEQQNNLINYMTEDAVKMKKQNDWQGSMITKQEKIIAELQEQLREIAKETE